MKLIIRYIIELYLFSLIQSINFFNIPLEKKNFYNLSMNESEIVKILHKNVLECRFMMGTPNQDLIFVPDFKESFSYLISQNTKLEDDILDLKKFYTNNSKTYKSILSRTSIYDKFDKFNYLYDNLNINNKIIYNISFLEILNFNPDYLHDIGSGKIGFGLLINKEYSTSKTNLIYQLKEKGLINSYSFFIRFNINNNGEIIIGGNLNEFNSNSNFQVHSTRTVSTLQKPSWGFIVDRLYYENETIDISENICLISLSSGVININKKLKEILDNSFFNELINKGICKIIKPYSYQFSSDTYVCNIGIDKSKLKILSLYSSSLNYTFNIDLSRLFEDIGNLTYFLLTYSQSNTITLGYPFIKNYTIGFNPDDKMIMFYSERKEKTKKNIFFIIIISILLILLIIVSYCWYKTYKKIPKLKKSIEMKDDYEYIPDET